MAQSTGQGGARSVMRAAARLDEIDREVAEILRVFPDLRVFHHGRARGQTRMGASEGYPHTKRGRVLHRGPVLH